MTLKQWFFNIFRGKTAKKERKLSLKEQLLQTFPDPDTQRQLRDISLANTGWKGLGLCFRNEGYNSEEWLAPPYSNPEEVTSRNVLLFHMHLHPLASYRALGLSKVVDYWVPHVAEQGWGKLTLELPYQLTRLGHIKQWGHIEHPAFWKEVAALMAAKDTTGHYTQLLLSHAGWAGNLVPFNALPMEQITRYSQSNPNCHPRIALWLQSKELWEEGRLLPSLGQWDDLFPLHGTLFLQWHRTAAVPIAYVLDWIEPILAHYPLLPEHKLSLVGQAILAFGPELWERNFAPTCQQYLDGLDMGLLYAVCDIQSPKATLIEQTVQRLTQNVNQCFDPMLVHGTLSNHHDVSKDILLLLDIQPPATRTELYTLAVLAKKMEQGLVPAPQSIPLPNLEF